MPVARFRLIILLISVAGSAGLWIVGNTFTWTEGQGRYGALVCDVSVPDDEIQKRLENNGFSGIISESGQWVLLDTFGRIERVALHEYHSRLLPFDPRNDGYAEKLRSLFIRDNKRIVYIPLDSPLTASTAKKIASAMGTISHSLVYGRQGGGGRQATAVLVVLCGAVCAFFLLRPVRLALRPHAAGLIPCLPPLVPLALGGGSVGFALASLLAGLTAIIAGPGIDRLTSPRRRPGGGFTIYLILLSLLIICCGVIIFFSGLPRLFMALAFILFCGVLVFSLWGDVKGVPSAASSLHKSGYQKIIPGKPRFGPEKPGLGGLGHHRFSPVLILGRPALNLSFSWVMLPFSAAACIVAVMGLLGRTPVSGTFPLPSAAALTEADYEAHCQFQSTFSFRSLNAADALPAEQPNDYALAADGLPVYSGSVPEEPKSSAMTDAIPPFPLGDLLQYLDTMGREKAYDRHDSLPRTVCSILLPLLFIIPGISVRKKSTEARGFTRRNRDTDARKK